MDANEIAEAWALPNPAAPYDGLFTIEDYQAMLEQLARAYVEMRDAVDKQSDRVRSSYRRDPIPECCATTATMLADMYDSASGRDSRNH